VGFADVYATDVFVFIKPGKMGERIPSLDLKRSAEEYGIPQIRIINPNYVICIGSSTYNSIRSVCGLTYMPIKRSFSEKPLEIGKSKIVAVHHTGGSATAYQGGPKEQDKEWSQIAKMIA
jgi:hypothetical protein